MKRYLIPILLIICNFIYAQKVDWLLTYGNEFSDYGRNLSVDSKGNVYSAGFFSKTIDLNPDGENGELVTEESLEMYLLKQDSNGNFIWAIRVDPGYAQTTGSLSLLNDSEDQIVL